MKNKITSKSSIYSYTFENGESIKNRGYDYKGKLFKNSMSTHLFKNDNVIGFIEYLDSIFFEYIEAVKKIRVFYNFTVDKDYKKIP